MSTTIPGEVLEATLILAPTKARQALMTTIAATTLFLLMYGREPTEGAVRDRFLKEALDVNCAESDIRWLADAALIDEEAFNGWKAATSEHA